MRVPLQTVARSDAPGAARGKQLALAGAAAASLIALFYGNRSAEAPGAVGEIQTSAPAVAPQSAAVFKPPASPTPTIPIAPISLPEGTVLKGVIGGGAAGAAAILEMPDGQQRTVRVGAEFLPKLVLSEIGLFHALFTSPGGELRMHLNRSATSRSAAGHSNAEAADSASAAQVTSGEIDHRGEAMHYRLGLDPRKSEGRIAGFAIREGAVLPALQKAGLRPGDVLVAVNGQAIESEEKVMELSREIAGSYTAEFEFIREGRRMKAALNVNPRT